MRHVHTHCTHTPRLTLAAPSALRLAHVWALTVRDRLTAKLCNAGVL